MEKITFIKSKFTITISVLGVVLNFSLMIFATYLSIKDQMYWFLGLLIIPIAIIVLSLYIFFSEMLTIEIDDEKIVERYIINKKIKKTIKVADIWLVEVVPHGFGIVNIYLYDKPKTAYGILSKKLFNIPYSLERLQLVKEVCRKDVTIVK